MPIGEWITTALVLLGVFFLAYSAIRQQGLFDTVKEIRDIIRGKYEDAKEVTGGLKYAN